MEINIPADANFENIEDLWKNEGGFLLATDQENLETLMQVANSLEPRRVLTVTGAFFPLSFRTARVITAVDINPNQIEYARNIVYEVQNGNAESVAATILDTYDNHINNRETNPYLKGSRSERDLVEDQCVWLSKIKPFFPKVTFEQGNIYDQKFEQNVCFLSTLPITELNPILSEQKDEESPFIVWLRNNDLKKGQSVLFTMPVANKMLRNGILEKFESLGVALDIKASPQPGTANDLVSVTFKEDRPATVNVSKKQNKLLTAISGLFSRK